MFSDFSSILTSWAWIPFLAIISLQQSHMNNSAVNPQHFVRTHTKIGTLRISSKSCVVRPKSHAKAGGLDYCLQVR